MITFRMNSGRAVVLGIVAVMVVGWWFYRDFVPPAWLRDFSSEISLRATPDPNAPPPSDTRQATPHVAPPHPYICFAKLTPFAWDRLVVVPSSGDMSSEPALLDAVWPGDELKRYTEPMKNDPRYQLIVLMQGKKVVADALYFTFWADLSLLARPQGFSPDEAVFIAAEKDGTHIVTPVAEKPAECN